MKKFVLFLMLFVCLRVEVKANEENYFPKTKDLIAKCVKDNFDENALSDKELAESNYRVTICIKKAVIKQLDFLFSHDEITKQEIISTIEQAEQNLVKAYTLSANNNKFCQTATGCGTINRYLLPASVRQSFYSDLLDTLQGFDW